MRKIFYHVYCDGYTKQLNSISEVQVWLDSKRHELRGRELIVWKVVNCLAQNEPVIQGIVT